MNLPMNRSPKTSYYIRIAAGGYLLYTAYSLNRDWTTVKPEHKLGIGAAIVVFAIAGFILCLVSAISLYKYNRVQAKQEEDDQAEEKSEDASESEDTNEVDSAGTISEENTSVEDTGEQESPEQKRP